MKRSRRSTPYIAKCGLERGLLASVKLRPRRSMAVPGVSTCILRSYAPQVTRSSVFISLAHGANARSTVNERLAFAWTEALTSLENCEVSDDLYSLVRREFSEEKLVKLTLAGVAINTANRINMAFRILPGTHQPRCEAGPHRSADLCRELIP